MVRRIEPEIAKNRSGRLRLGASFITTGVGRTPGAEPDASGGEPGDSLAVTGNQLGVAVEAAVYTRDLGSDADPALVVGHPDPEHGVGRGAVGGGASGGGWTLVAEPDVSLTTAARRALVDALVAPEGTIATVGVAESGGNERETYAYGVLSGSAGADSAAATARGIYRFHEHGGAFAMLTAATADGTTIAESSTGDSTGTVAVANDQELRVDLRVTVTPDPVGDAVVTDTGENALAASLVRPAATSALAGVAIGSGEGTIDEATTSLVAPIDERTDEATAVIAPGRIAIRGEWYRYQPDTQPVTVRELGVVDGDDDLVYQVPIAPTEKTERAPLTAGVAFTLRER